MKPAASIIGMAMYDFNSPGEEEGEDWFVRFRRRSDLGAVIIDGLW